ncbi:hypothetical protein Tco_0076042, partial [Tanacetum coccineum]
MEDLEQAFVVYTSSRTDEARSKQFTTIQGPRNFSEATNDWKDKPNFNWARAQSFTSPQGGSLSTYSSIYQTKLKRALSNFDSHQEKSVGIKRLHGDLEVTAAK